MTTPKAPKGHPKGKPTQEDYLSYAGMAYDALKFACDKGIPAEDAGIVFAMVLAKSLGQDPEIALTMYRFFEQSEREAMSEYMEQGSVVA